jgi:hypothetical protein
MYVACIEGGETAVGSVGLLAWGVKRWNIIIPRHPFCGGTNGAFQDLTGPPMYSAIAKASALSIYSMLL